jgi:ABC-type phosphate/phosphonate transport system ATPase subunit
MPESILSLKNLTIGYEDELIHSIDLQVEIGDIIAIVGPSGLGKTTLLRVIAGLITPLNGEITWRKIRKRGGIGYIPQRLGLVRHASVFHNVDLGARAGTTPSWNIFRWSKERSIDVKEAIDEMGLSEKMYQPIRKLSGGQQRRVATARTLAQKPKLILADEFLSELDQDNVNNIMNVFKSYIENNDAAMILVEHDIERAKKISTKILEIKDSQLRIFSSGVEK